MRSTVKQQNAILDQIKHDTGLKSRQLAYEFLYTKAAHRFAKLGYHLSHYKDGCITLTSDHMKYHHIDTSDIYTPHHVVDSLNA